MSIKVFIAAPSVSGYDGNGDFHISMPYDVFTFNNGNFDSYNWSMQITIPLGSSAFDVYGLIYAQVLTDCAANSLPTPTKSDIFGYAPQSMLQLLPDIPSFA